MLTDQQGSDSIAVSSAAGTLSRDRYLPYGGNRSTSFTLPTHRGWLGQVQDKDTGLDYLNACYCDPVLAHFLSTDPADDQDSAQAANAYAYAADDNESAVGSWRAGRPQLTETFAGFAGSLGTGVIQCRPRDPEAKGLVERANGYMETSFLPGRVFTGPGDFDTQLTGWLQKANTRHHRRLGCRPIDRLETDLGAMLALPPVAPLIGWRLSTRLPRDYYVRLDSNDYSVHPDAIGRMVTINADLSRVTVTCAGTVVAEHERCWDRHQSITDPAHRAAADRQRQRRRDLTTLDSIGASIGAGSRAGREVQVVTRALSYYDRAAHPDTFPAQRVSVVDEQVRA